MIFLHGIDAILDGRKTQVRLPIETGERLVQTDRADCNCPCIVQTTEDGERILYAVGQQRRVQPSAGQAGVATIRILDIRREDITRVDETALRTDGGLALREFVEVWRSNHGDATQAWVITFELVSVDDAADNGADEPEAEADYSDEVNDDSDSDETHE